MNPRPTTIVVPKAERVVIVFPATMDSNVVMVDDVIVSVDRAVREGVTERCGEFGRRWREKKRSSLKSI